VVGVGISQDGLDFDAPDGRPAHIVFLILTAPQDDGAQVELLADIGRIFEDRACASGPSGCAASPSSRRC
jgi:mannitol/fructose-specific phosphotransferase system IIA component (Ntr-type)